MYAPTSFVFSAVLFGATLLNRRVITPLEFGVVFGAIVGVLLVSARRGWPISPRSFPIGHAPRAPAAASRNSFT